LPHFDVQNHPWWWPAKVSKTSLEKMQKARNSQANGSKAGIQNRKIGGIFDDCFEAFPASFLEWVLNGFWDGFWIDFYIIFMVY
jgi:hypothetical protein